MANIKVSELPTATQFNDDDYTMIVQNNTTKKISKENMYRNYIYSSDEVVVGKWIDGKPIYRKVISTDSLVGEQDYKSISHGISNFSKLVGLKCIANNGGGYFFDFNNYQASSETSIPVRVFVDNTNISVYDGTPIYWVDEAYFILEYTKTTD